MGIASGLTIAMLAYLDRLSTVSTRRHRPQAPQNCWLLSPEHATSLVRDQDVAHTIDYMFHFGRPYRMAAHDAGTAGASMNLVYAIDNGQAPLR